MRASFRGEGLLAKKEAAVAAITPVSPSSQCGESEADFRKEQPGPLC